MADVKDHWQVGAATSDALFRPLDAEHQLRSEMLYHVKDWKRNGESSDSLSNNSRHLNERRYAQTHLKMHANVPQPRGCPHEAFQRLYTACKPGHTTAPDTGYATAEYVQVSHGLAETLSAKAPEEELHNLIDASGAYDNPLAGTARRHKREDGPRAYLPMHFEDYVTSKQATQLIVGLMRATKDLQCKRTAGQLHFQRTARRLVSDLVDVGIYEQRSTHLHCVRSPRI